MPLLGLQLFFFLPASIAVILISGSKLAVNVVAQKYIRKRVVPKHRWIGCGLVLIGLVVVTSADFAKGGNIEVQSWGLGLLFVALKSFVGVCLDITQELFTQEANFPATMLLGLEGIYGLILFMPIYFLATPLTGYNPTQAWGKAVENTAAICLTIGLVFVMFFAGTFKILAAAILSSMTQNLWVSSFRGPTVWVLELFLYYVVSDGKPSILIGEPWFMPGSFLFLVGLVINFGGVWTYYNHGGNDDSDSSSQYHDDDKAGTRKEVDSDVSENSSDIWV